MDIDGIALVPVKIHLLFKKRGWGHPLALKAIAVPVFHFHCQGIDSTVCKKLNLPWQHKNVLGVVLSSGRLHEFPGIFITAAHTVELCSIENIVNVIGRVFIHLRLQQA